MSTPLESRAGSRKGRRQPSDSISPETIPTRSGDRSLKALIRSAPVRDLLVAVLAVLGIVVALVGCASDAKPVEALPPPEELDGRMTGTFLALRAPAASHSLDYGNKDD